MKNEVFEKNSFKLGQYTDNKVANCVISEENEQYCLGIRHKCGWLAIK